MKKSLILFLIGLSLFGHADEFLDVETLPKFRTHQYAKGSYEKIVIHSAPRTGSSLVYNVFKFLFEDTECLSYHHFRSGSDGGSVFKTHEKRQVESLKDENVLYVVPIRHPLNSAISHYRVQSSRIRKIKHWCGLAIQTQIDHLTFVEKLQKKKDVIFIKYEDFIKNLDVLLGLIETYFNISISPLDKDLMRYGYNKENIHANVESLRNHENFLPISGFHGNHISLEKYTPPNEVLYWLNHYLQDAIPLYRKYGYFQ